MKLILSAGAFRSASTLQFNILRVILEQAYTDIYSCFIAEYNPESEVEVHLVKIHQPNEELAGKADFIFSSIRDREGIVNSIKRRIKFNDQLSVDLIDSYLAWWQFWALRSDFIQSYKMIENMDLLINSYINILRVGVSVGGVKAQLEREMIEPPEGFVHHDPKTLLHYKHITK